MIPGRPAGAPDILSYGYGGGLGPASGPYANSGYGAPSYTDLFENLRKQAQAEADRAYGLQRDQLRQQYDIAKMNARTARERLEVDRWYNEQQVQLAQQRLAQEQQQFQTKMGYDLVNMAANLTGPADYFKMSNLARGVAGNPQTSTFLSALQNNSRLAGFNAQAGTPERLTLDSLMARLGGGSAPPTPTSASAPVATQATQQAASGGGGAAPVAAPTGGVTGPLTGNTLTMNANAAPQDNSQAYLAQIGGIGQAGAHKLGAGVLEQLTPTEFKLFEGGLSELGYDPATFMAQHQRSRIGQGIGLSRKA